jgi:L-lactate dehydrogenase complex protein LldF
MASEQHFQGAEFLTANTHGLREPAGSKSLATCSERSAKHNTEITDAIPQWQTWRQTAHDIKAYTIAHLDTLLEEFVAKLEAKGITVLWARDAEEANRHVMELAREHQVKTVVKAKSMVSEELELNHALESMGIRSLETDLGEYIVQLAGQRPTHVVTPALHLSAAEIGELFAEKLNEPKTEEHESLTRIARKHLREHFVHADMGLSGVNFGIVETGSFCVIENEGNIGLSTTAPKVHVALMGIEKLIPRLADLPLFLNMLPRIGTGQKLTSYAHLFHGPTPGRKMYLVVVDNGRTHVLADPKAHKTLHCIRCGTCLNNCPVYRQVGGWAYGWVYPGPIGSVLNPQLKGLKEAGKLPFASSLCGACSEICPVKIDLAHQLVHLRHRAVEEESPAKSWFDRLTWKGFAWGMKGPLRYRLTMAAVKLGVRLAPLLPWKPGQLGQWTRGRSLPKPPAEGAFRDWWKRHRKNR